MARRVAITGSTGLIGEALVKRLRGDGWDVVRVRRKREQVQGDDLFLSPSTGEVDAAGFEGLDAVVHLAGEPIGDSRWTDEVKQRILDSRVDGTRLLAETLAKLDAPPSVLVSGSAIGFYGDRGDEVLTEDATSGDGFLADVVVAWEAATAAADNAGIRVVHARTGIVLTPDGGALAKMLLPFKLGVGGRIGSGQQWYPWISLTDEVEALAHLLTDDTLHGPVNLTAPTPVTNAAFTKALGDVLNRPTVFPIPVLAMRVLYGEMGVNLTATSTRVVPEKLMASSFGFQHTDVRDAIAHELDA